MDFSARYKKKNRNDGVWGNLKMEPFSVQCQYIEGLKWVGCKVLLNEETVFHPCFQPAQLQCIGVNVLIIYKIPLNSIDMDDVNTVDPLWTLCCLIEILQPL